MEHRGRAGTADAGVVIGRRAHGGARGVAVRADRHHRQRDAEYGRRQRSRYGRGPPLSVFALYRLGRDRSGFCGPHRPGLCRTADRGGPGHERDQRHAGCCRPSRPGTGRHRSQSRLRPAPGRRRGSRRRGGAGPGRCPVLDPLHPPDPPPPPAAGRGEGEPALDHRSQGRRDGSVRRGPESDRDRRPGGRRRQSLRPSATSPAGLRARTFWCARHDRPPVEDGGLQGETRWPATAKGTVEVPDPGSRPAPPR